MERQVAAQLLRDELNKHNLTNWKVRLTSNINQRFLALCSYKDECIIINTHHIDLHDEKEILNTIRHEIAHALCPRQGHNEVWANKAKEIGCTDNSPCAFYGLPEHIIDAIRSGSDVEVEFDEKIIRTPKYTVTRLQDKCPQCKKVAISKSEKVLETKDPFQPNLKIILLECGHTLVKKIPKGTPFASLVSNSRNKPAVNECKHEWNKNQCNSCGEYRPFEFQIEGMKFAEAALSTQSGVGIFDEMGLGKTIQSLGYLYFHPEDFPVLYVVKSSIKYQWLKQILTWLGNLHYAQIIQSSNDYLIPGLKGYIISYDMMVFKTRTLKSGKQATQGFDIKKFDTVGIKTVVLDECQQIKNPDSSRTQQVRRLVKGRKVIALSGTPWKNKGSEFFSVLNMMDPLKFHSYQRYITDWVDTYYHGNILKYGGIKNPDQFKSFVKDIVIRRERTEVMKELPLVNRMRIYIQLDELRQEEYDNEVSNFVKWYNDVIINGEEESGDTSMNILAKMQRMRHVTGLAKIPATVEFVKDFIEETDRKLCIFAHHKDVQYILYEQLTREFPDIKVLKLTGEQSGLERFEVQEEFNGTNRCILVASTLAAGEGLNLQTGADCVIHERQWNPANEEQAEGRFIRIGQTATSVNATYPLGEGTIDDLFDEIVERKRNWFHSGMNKSKDANRWDQSDLGKQLAEAIVKRFKDKNKGKSIRKEMVKI